MTVLQVSRSEGTETITILKLNTKNNLDVLLNEINELFDQKQLVVIYNPKMFRETENGIKLEGIHNYRKFFSPLYFYTTNLDRKRHERRKTRAADDHVSKWVANHQTRMNYVNETLINRFGPTIYIHNEMKRILRDGKVFDTLRRMIVHLELPGNELIKQNVLDCYKKVKPPPVSTGWENIKTNILVRHIVKDPYNDNVN